ncbi:hypothetical protein [Nonlabens sp. Asnod2-A12]|uniref:hypothetical protein n=1 Tax=Nonlabens sp. Asnod2-A12 TaxID=3160578 RepID=UPI00386DA2AD
MKYLFAFLFFTITFFAVAQNQDLNDYKYIVVENQYDFQSEANEYRLNELIVFEFKKRNFNAFRNAAILPEDMNRGVCNALQLKIDKSGSLTRNLILRLVNCAGDTVFTTKKGVGRTKSNDKAYFEALRDAMTSFDAVDYEFKEMLSVSPKAIDSKSISDRPNVEIVAMIGESSHLENTSKSEKNVVDDAAPSSEYEFTSKEGYALMKSAKGFLIFDNNLPIGVALKKSNNAYLVHTSEFAGVGYMNGDNFVIEYINNKKEQIIEFVNVP